MCVFKPNKVKAFLRVSGDLKVRNVKTRPDLAVPALATLMKSRKRVGTCTKLIVARIPNCQRDAA